jgi:hypothetical protein
MVEAVILAFAEHQLVALRDLRFAVAAEARPDNPLRCTVHEPSQQDRGFSSLLRCQTLRYQHAPRSYHDRIPFTEGELQDREELQMADKRGERVIVSHLVPLLDTAVAAVVASLLFAAGGRYHDLAFSSRIIFVIEIVGKCVRPFAIICSPTLV